MEQDSDVLQERQEQQFGRNEHHVNPTGKRFREEHDWVEGRVRYRPLSKYMN